MGASSASSMLDRQGYPCFLSLRCSLSALSHPCVTRPEMQMRHYCSRARVSVGFVFFLLTFLFSGCSSVRTGTEFQTRPFEFQNDTFAYANELRWEYFHDADGKWR